MRSRKACNEIYKYTIIVIMAIFGAKKSYEISVTRLKLWESIFHYFSDLLLENIYSSSLFSSYIVIFDSIYNVFFELVTFIFVYV
jgi:hypothetical protein